MGAMSQAAMPWMIQKISQDQRLIPRNGMKLWRKRGRRSSDRQLQ